MLSDGDIHNYGLGLLDVINMEKINREGRESHLFFSVQIDEHFLRNLVENKKKAYFPACRLHNLLRKKTATLSLRNCKSFGL